MTTVSFETQSSKQTLDIGRWLGQRLPRGTVVALCGDLGAGKTQLCKGLVSGAAGLHPDTVTSPTFTLHNIHQPTNTAISSPVHHLDVYRLRAASELAGLGWDDILRSKETVLLEWADRVAELVPAHSLKITLSHALQPETRTILLEIPNHPRYQQLLADLRQFDPRNFM